MTTNGTRPAAPVAQPELEAAAPPMTDTARAAVARLLEALGEEPTRSDLADTPRRVADALRELTSGKREEPREILSRVFEDPFDGLVLVKGIEFTSLCEHHLLPFRGTASIAYLPAGRIVGLSKLARLVEALAGRLQVQERLTRELADAVEEHLHPRGVAVLVEGEHLCMSARGARTAARTVTTAFRGDLRAEAARREFLAHVYGRVAMP